MIEHILTIAAFAAADRISGSEICARLHLPGRPIYYVSVALGVLAWLTVVPLGAAIMFVIWRSFSWRPGSLDVNNADQANDTFYRHLLVLFAAPWFPWLVIFPFVATGLAAALGWFGRRNRDVNPWVETLRGVAFGVLV